MASMWASLPGCVIRRAGMRCGVGDCICFEIQASAAGTDAGVEFPCCDMAVL